MSFSCLLERSELNYNSSPTILPTKSAHIQKVYIGSELITNLHVLSCFNGLFYRSKHQLPKYFNDNQKLSLRDVVRQGKIHQIHL